MPQQPENGNQELDNRSSASVRLVDVSEEMKSCFIDYAMSVIISRALPDVRDGLKPSQRRILFAMHELGLAPNRKHLKCAKIVGETMGNFHPHGDQAIYPTLVHMAQPWAMREVLIDGQGNFGSIEGDPPAAMRYTEARLSSAGALLMADMEKDTVDFVPNYDETRMEPSVFPAAFPNLVVNGGTGIAVGMATNIPPHNLSETIDGLVALIDQPGLSTDDLLRYIQGPDFPTGGVILGKEGIAHYFATGRGSLKVRGTIHFEELRGGKSAIIIDEIPYNVNRAALVEKIGELVNQKVIPEILDIRDESDENTRVVIELKRDAIPKVVANNLYKHTPLQTNFAVNMVAIDRLRPKSLNLKELLSCYLDHRHEVVVRRTRFDLNKALERAEILEGFLIALSRLEDFIQIIRQSSNRDEARRKLLGLEFLAEEIEALGIADYDQRLNEGEIYRLTLRQVEAILDLRLYQLTGLEREKIASEYAELLAKIKEFREILASEEKIWAIVRAELLEVKEKYGNPRKTKIVADEGEVAFEDLIANQRVVITLTHNGFIKRTSLDSYRSQRRGGRGVIGMSTLDTGVEEERDFVESLFNASTHDYLLFFTTDGRVYIQRVYEIPEKERASKGKNIASILELKPTEEIASMLRIVANPQSLDGREYALDKEGYIFFCTSKGKVKKTAICEFRNIRKGGITAISIDENDKLIDCMFTDGQKEIVLITREGQSIRFAETDVRPMGRNAAGVNGIDLQPGDEVVGATVVDNRATLLVVSEKGIGKRTSFDEYRKQKRAGFGIKTMKTTDKTGKVVSALTVLEDDELMLLTLKGNVIRIRIKDLRKTGRNTQGVRLVQMDSDDKVTSIARIIPDKEENEETLVP
ncbi:DNA gyrase subunit A [Methylacidiphilum caldifontis]|uniref:DNA gyrase subunit A n=1 Tax=Methylacidiphilum caldifontis TaxID=2795386 RepID=A0A4Y8PBZ9_9BACT|nr:DNA gyrase subunit A [Methylacidiphilum caldifontis]QSR88150.1 DNA gyrase subunit A [Methylacidiphilum caldifontis]TFE68189.1 DNA gyrase subunit A [Methylacidiphilum caldifontis]